MELSRVEIRLHTENQPPRLCISVLKVSLGGGGVVENRNQCQQKKSFSETLRTFIFYLWHLNNFKFFQNKE